MNNTEFKKLMVNTLRDRLPKNIKWKVKRVLFSEYKCHLRVDYWIYNDEGELIFKGFDEYYKDCLTIDSAVSYCKRAVESIMEEYANHYLKPVSNWDIYNESNCIYYYDYNNSVIFWSTWDMTPFLLQSYVNFLIKNDYNKEDVIRYYNHFVEHFKDTIRCMKEKCEARPDYPSIVSVSIEKFLIDEKQSDELTLKKIIKEKCCETILKDINNINDVEGSVDNGKQDN